MYPPIMLYLIVMVLSPLDLVQQVSQVGPDWDVVFPRPQIAVEVLVVARILLQHNAVSSQKVRQPICCHSAIDVYLVLVLVVEKKSQFINNHKSHKIYIHIFMYIGTYD